MEDENIFSEEEQNIFGESFFRISSENFRKESQMVLEAESFEQEAPELYQEKERKFKAHNPLDRLSSLPQDQRKEYEFMMNNHKTFNGIQYFFEIGEEKMHSEQFLKGIESDALDNPNSSLELDKLFLDMKETPKEHLDSILVDLRNRIAEIHSRNLNSINFNRTVASSFYEHFENFALVFDSKSFAAEMESSITGFMLGAKKMKGPGIDLISTIYEFWMKMFKDFTNEIWKHSSKFTLNFFKKDPLEQRDDCDSNLQAKSDSSVGRQQKRKRWSTHEQTMLEEIINSNIIFSQSVLQKIASSLGRSVTAVSSKIQKLIKQKKGDQIQDQSLLKRAIQVLKLYPEGLNRESIIERINENYQMGYGGQWEKSIGQLLSNRKQFTKVRGKNRLLNPERYLDRSNSEHSQMLSFKDKVIECFLHCPGYESDLRSLVDIYISLFPEGEQINEQRRKSIEVNISKTLSRYNIFDNSCAKTIYTYSFGDNKDSTNNVNMEQQLDHYFDI